MKFQRGFVILEYCGASLTVFIYETNVIIDSITLKYNVNVNILNNFFYAYYRRSILVSEMFAKIFFYTILKYFYTITQFISFSINILNSHK